MPDVFIIAGPNGAGKTTASHALLSPFIDCETYINADYIAAAMNPLKPEINAIAAGRQMLLAINQHLERNASFAFETTLSTRSFLPLFKQYNHYQLTIIYLWLSSPEIAVRRVKERVSEGGHHVPEDVIRRRYTRSLYNFFELYEPFAKRWVFYNNSENNPLLIARKNGNLSITDHELWKKIKSS